MSLVKTAYSSVFEKGSAQSKGSSAVAMPFFNSEMIEKANQLTQSMNPILLQRVGSYIDVGFGRAANVPNTIRTNHEFTVIRSEI
jgi:hypothetical protein